MALRFGDCLFDAETRQLFRDGKAVAVSPKAFRLLEHLIQKAPKAISKEELQDVLWPKTFVSEGNLARLAAEIREAIGDSAHDPRFLRTVHGFGYSFQGELSPARPLHPTGVREDVVFKLIWGDREIALFEGENILGRDRDSVAWIDVYSVSRHHARIVISGEHATLEDLGSKNGTYLRGQKIEFPSALNDGDLIRIGSVPMTFRRFTVGTTTETARSR